MLGVSKNTVRAALRSAGPPKYERVGRASIVDEVEPRIRELLRAFPTMPATVIAERIGWNRSITVLKERVAELRPVYLPPDPASRTAYVAGEIAQFDLWFPPISLPVGSARPARPPPHGRHRRRMTTRGSTFSRRYGVNFEPSLTTRSRTAPQRARPAQLWLAPSHGSAPGGPPGGRHGPGG